jgi:hypothetical protein
MMKLRTLELTLTIRVTAPDQVDEIAITDTLNEALDNYWDDANGIATNNWKVGSLNCVEASEVARKQDAKFPFTCYIEPKGDAEAAYYDGDYASSEGALNNFLAGIYDGALETGDVLQVVNNITGTVLWWHTVTANEKDEI